MVSGSRKRSTITSQKRHKDALKKLIRELVDRQFMHPGEVSDYFVDAMSNNRSLDDIAGELSVWSKDGSHTT